MTPMSIRALTSASASPWRSVPASICRGEGNTPPPVISLQLVKYSFNFPTGSKALTKSCSKSKASFPPFTQNTEILFSGNAATLFRSASICSEDNRRGNRAAFSSVSSRSAARYFADRSSYRLFAASAFVSAIPDLSSADCALVSALVALSLREPINCPEMLFVCTKQKSSTANDTISKSVDRLASLFLRSSSPAVNQSVKSEMYSPAQARATNAHATYSAFSQQDRDRVNEDTSGAVKVILNHKRRENRVFATCAICLVLLFIAKMISYLRWESSIRHDKSHKQSQD
jgi:hypothetical protein